MKRLFLCLSLCSCCLLMNGQARYDTSKMATEQLNRGVVAIRQADGRVFVSWRILDSDNKQAPFDVFRNGVKLNEKALKTGGSCFIDEHPLLGEDAIYEVRGGNTQGAFTLKKDAPAEYLTIKLDKPDYSRYEVRGARYENSQTSGKGNLAPRTSYLVPRNPFYTANDCSVGDVDGDGQYEVIVKWEPSNARDNSHDGYTGPTLFDCYRLTGEHLWRINMGRNIRSGAHYVPFIVYDLDGDGRAELTVKTADGTIDGTGQVIGDSTNDHRNKAGRILEGPEYITVFDGLTGRALDTKPYLPERGDVSGWGDSRGNRSERYLAAVGYFSRYEVRDTRCEDSVTSAESNLAPRTSYLAPRKQTPSAVFCRGYYTRSVLAAWDWDGKELKSRWVFDTNEPQWRSYAGQGNHNLRVADVDGDGLDEITYGSMCVDHDGTGLYNTGMGHGDAMHLVADPKDNRLYIWDCHENKRDGSELRDAQTGKVVFQIKSRTDVGRAMAADIDPTSYGMEMWSTDSHGIRNMKGKVVSTARDANDPQHENTLVLNGRYLPVNFGIWWDGDLLRELLDHEVVWKYNWQEKSIDQLQRFEGRFNNGTKSNPCLQADILGDWREEVIIRNQESTELRVYSTTIPTDYRINCLMQDIPYRLSVATENVGYNQPPEPGYYIGPDRQDYLK